MKSGVQDGNLNNLAFSKAWEKISWVESQSIAMMKSTMLIYAKFVVFLNPTSEGESGSYLRQTSFFTTFAPRFCSRPCSSLAISTRTAISAVLLMG